MLTVVPFASVSLLASGTVHCTPVDHGIWAPCGGLHCQLPVPVRLEYFITAKLEFHMLSVVACEFNQYPKISPFGPFANWTESEVTTDDVEPAAEQFTKVSIFVPVIASYMP